MNRRVASLALAVVLAGATIADDPAATAAGTGDGPATLTGSTAAEPAEDESWTWFGMGFENRRQHLERGHEGFGPASRPSGGFGQSGRRGGNSGAGRGR